MNSTYTNSMHASAARFRWNRFLARAAVEQGLRRVLGGFNQGRARGERAGSTEQAPVVSAIPQALLKAEVEALRRSKAWSRAGASASSTHAPADPWCLQEIGACASSHFARRRRQGKASTRPVRCLLPASVRVDAQPRQSWRIPHGAHRRDPRALRQARPVYAVAVQVRVEAPAHHQSAIELGAPSCAQNTAQLFRAPAPVARNRPVPAPSPHYAVLFGPVSISSSYAPPSRS